MARRTPNLAPVTLAGLCLATALTAALTACSSSEKKDDGLQQVEVDELDPVRIVEEEVPIGKYLVELDVTTRAWTKLTHTASSDQERRKARQLETVLRHRSRLRMDELIVQLETGPPQNRVRAASALGFTGSEKALSPLLGALSDPSPDVVHNALLGLALLGLPETPLDEICELMATSRDDHTRSNAAYALRYIVENGSESSLALNSARLGLVDPEPLVRVQSALVLGLLADPDSIPALGDLIYDDTPLVTQAALEAMVLITEDDGTHRGPVARVLVPAMQQAPSEVRPRVRRSLIEIAGRDLGKEYQEWLSWAERLP